MALARLALRPDGRQATAAVGIAAAILLPLMAILAFAALGSPGGPGDPSPAALDASHGWVVMRDPAVVTSSGTALFDANQLQGVTLAVRHAESEGHRLAAYVVGPPVVAAGDALPMPAAAEALQDAGITTLRIAGSASDAQTGDTQNLTVRPPPGGPLDLLSSGDILVAPTTLPSAASVPEALRSASAVPADAAFVSVEPATELLSQQGLVALASPGATSYLRGGVSHLRDATGILVAASLPVAALVAVGFGDLEARRLSRTMATMAALGQPRVGMGILAVRTGIASAVGMMLAAVFALAVYFFGPAAFHPMPFPRAEAVASVLGPGLLAFVVSTWRARARLGSTTRLLRAPMSETEAPSRRVPLLPAAAQPILVGTRAMPILLLAALLFAVDLGFPLAASMVPGAVAGQRGELVLGQTANVDGDSLLATGGRVSRAPADALVDDPSLDAVLGEVIVPTTIRGEPVMVRGGTWGHAVKYHGFHLESGTPPGASQIVLGTAVASRLGLGAGDVVLVPASTRPVAFALTVSGILAGPTILEDEGYVMLSTGQDLAGLAPTDVTLVRARPDTLDAITALTRTEPELRVTSITHTPHVPAAGELVTVQVHLVNLGGRAGERPLYARINDEVMSRTVARLDGYARGNVTMHLVAPAGPFTLSVNPSEDVQVQRAAARLLVPDIAFGDASLRIAAADGTGLAGRTVALYPSLDAVAARQAPLDKAVSDANGRLVLGPLAPGTFVAALLEPDGTTPSGVVASLTAGDPAHAHEAWIVVEEVFMDPPRPVVQGEASLVVRARNVGGLPGDGLIVVATVLDEELAQRPVALLPGRGASVLTAVPIATIDAQVQFKVDNVTYTFATSAAPQGADVGPVPRLPGSVRSSQAVQKQVADAVLVQARQALVAIGATAMLASLAVVHMATERSLRGRMHALRALHGLGLDAPRLRSRAAFEAAALGGAAGLVAAAGAFVLFAVLEAIGWPVVFGHRLPNPVDWAFAIETAVTFAAVAGIAAYRVARRLAREVVRGRALLSPS